MIDSLLVSVFLSLSKKELRDLHKFVRSPFFNQRDDVIRLFDYLSECQPKNAAQYAKSNAYKVVFPNQPYDDQLMRYAMSFLLQTIKEYLKWQSLAQDTQSQQTYLCQQWRRRGLSKFFERELSAAQKAQEKQEWRNAHYHYHNYQLHLERHQYEHTQRRSGKAYLQELLNEFTNFYLAEMLRFGCTIQSYQQMSAEAFDLRVVEALTDLVVQTEDQQEPAVQLYLQAYQMLKEADADQHFHRFKQYIQRDGHLFPGSERKDLHLLGINYCIQKLNRGQRAYIAEALDLYKAALEEKLLLEDGQLSKFNYNNILLLALAEKEWDWAKAFLETYKPFLPPAERENSYRYNLANYHFRRNEYDAAMELLIQVSFNDIQYDLNARRMLLKMYYERQEFDALDSLLDSFAQFLRRRKELGYHRENYANLIGIVRQMLRVDLKDDSIRQNLQAKVSETAALAEKAWLMEQLEDLPPLD